MPSNLQIHTRGDHIFKKQINKQKNPKKSNKQKKKPQKPDETNEQKMLETRKLKAGRMRPEHKNGGGD